MSRLRVAMLLLMPSVAVVLLFGAALLWRATAIRAATTTAAPKTAPAKSQTSSPPAEKAPTDAKKADKPAAEPQKEAPKAEPKQDAAKPDAEKKPDETKKAPEVPQEVLDRFEQYQSGAAQSDRDLFQPDNRSGQVAPETRVDDEGASSTGKLKLHGPDWLEK